MPFIQWSPLLSVGIESVDKQHQKLVDIVNSLSDALEQGHADDVLEEIFDELTAYTVEHFAYEEELFEKYGYPDARAHIEEHRQLIEEVNQLKIKQQQQELMISVEVMNFLKAWLTEHILKSDSAFAPFLMSKGVT